MTVVDASARTALAVMAAQLRGDDGGVIALLDDEACDLRDVAAVLTIFAAESVRLASGREASDGDLSDLVGVHLRRLAREAG